MSLSDATTYTMFAWPATGGVWVVSYPLVGPPGHRNRGTSLLRESGRFQSYCKARNQKWVDVVQLMPGAAYVAEPSRETVARFLSEPSRERYLSREGGNALMPVNWLVYLQRCFADDCAYAWPAEANGGFWVARGLSQPEMEASCDLFYQKTKEINHLLQQARAEVIQTLGGTFYANAMESPAVRRLHENDPDRPALNELGQPYTDLWGTT